MKIPNNYHSAFSDAKTNLRELDVFKRGNKLVFQHDIKNGTHPAFHDCDFVYTEPAWRSGYEKFQIRANVEMSTHKKYLVSIKSIIEELQKPTIIIGGLHMLKVLSPLYYTHIKLHQMDSIAMFWNMSPITTKKTVDLLDILAVRHGTMLDFSCGYGSHLHRFNNFICSDINRNCVYYVAKTYMGYGD